MNTRAKGRRSSGAPGSVRTRRGDVINRSGAVSRHSFWDRIGAPQQREQCFIRAGLPVRRRRHDAALVRIGFKDEPAVFEPWCDHPTRPIWNDVVDLPVCSVWVCNLAQCHLVSAFGIEKERLPSKDCAKGRRSSGAPTGDLLAVSAVGPGRVSTDYASPSGLLAVLAVPLQPVSEKTRGGEGVPVSCHRICHNTYRREPVGAGALCPNCLIFRRVPALTGARFPSDKREVGGSTPPRPIFISKSPVQAVNPGQGFCFGTLHSALLPVRAPLVASGRHDGSATCITQIAAALSIRQ